MGIYYPSRPIGADPFDVNLPAINETNFHENLGEDAFKGTLSNTAFGLCLTHVEKQ